MNKHTFLSLFISAFLAVVMSCEPIQDKKLELNDRTSIIETFEKLKSDPDFLKENGLEGEEQFNWGDTANYQIILGDVDNDSTWDALISYTIEGRGGGNNFDFHYALLLNKETGWQYKGKLDASMFADDCTLIIDKIQNSVIKGVWKGSSTLYNANYIYSKGQIINVLTSLHKTENIEREYLYIVHVLDPENRSIPMSSDLHTLRQLIGEPETFFLADDQDCGGYWEEQTYRILEYSNLRFEVNADGQAVLTEIKLPTTGWRLQSDKGTIDQNTTMEELKAVFYQEDSWIILNLENDQQIFAVPDGAESDTQWRFLFDKNGRLIGVSLFVPC